MNEILKSLYDRKSMRVFEDKPITEDIKYHIINAALQAPTAGNQMLYTILEIESQELKEKLAVLCDNQPFIAKSPYVLIFLADCQRWYDTYKYAGANPREPLAGDILLAIEDAMIAAQNSVVAAESLGVGSCYIGDILENNAAITDLLKLEKYVIPITMLVFGYPTAIQKERQKPKRFDKKYIVMKDRYRRLTEEEHKRMHSDRSSTSDYDFQKNIQAFCERKYMSDFSAEMSRSAEEYLKNFLK